MYRCLIVFLTLSVGTWLSTGHAGQKLAYQVGQEQYEAYWTAPTESAPLVVIIHDWDGLTEYEMKRVDMLGELGYAAFAVDLYGAGMRPTATEDKRRLSGALYQDRARMRELVAGALVAAKAQGLKVDQAVAAGYCFGGAVVLEMARSGLGLQGFASFHGGLQTPPGQDYSRTQSPVLVLHGSADTAVTMDHFAALASELERAEVPHQMVTYGGAPHGFTNFTGGRYQAEADTKSWDEFTRFLQQTLP